MSDPRLGGRPHLDFCSGGEFCSLDDCLCDCHMGCATRALTDLRERVNARLAEVGDWTDLADIVGLIDDAIAAQKGAS